MYRIHSIYRALGLLALAAILAILLAACGGEEEPAAPAAAGQSAATPTAEAMMEEATATPVPIPTATQLPTATPTPLPTATPSPTPEPTNTPTPTVAPSPDLVVDAPTVGSSSPMAGEAFELTVTVRNRGAGPSGPTMLTYYRSDDSTVTPTDTEAGTAQVPGLDASGSSVKSISLTAPSTPGVYYYGACADPAPGESDTANNCSSAVDVTVLPHPPDLVVDAPTVGSSSPMAGEAFELTVTVRNRGAGPSGPTTLTYYRSDDSTVTPTDTEVGTAQVPGLDASGSSVKSISLTAPSTPGVYYYGACADPAPGESDTANNCSSAVDVTVLPHPPDLVVDAPTVGSSSPMAGEAFELTVTVRNRGAGPSGPTTLTYYRSDDSTVTPTDTEVGSDGVAGLSASESSAESTLTYAPSTPGMYYYGVCTAAVSGESDTTDNCSDAVAVAVSQFDIDSLPWVADGVTDSERQAMDQIRAFARIDPSMSQRVAGSPWLSDGVTEDELRMLADLRYFSRVHPETAVLVTTVPDQTGRLIGAVLKQIRFYDSGLVGQIQEQPWFQDGLTEDEAALIVVLRSAYETDDVFQDLLESGHVRSETISLPLAGEVDLFAVGRSERGLEAALERIAFAVESMEGFMGTPWPRADVIALLEFKSDLGSPTSAGLNYGTHIVVKNTSKNLTYHELAHFYFGIGAYVPFWLSEGAADFLMLYTLRLTGHETSDIDTIYIVDQMSIAVNCAPHGSTSIQEWIETGAGDPYCPYWLGRQFLRGMYRTLGHEVVSSALRELYERDKEATEEEIYQAFLTNTPSSRRDEFRDWYHCLHGRPILGHTAAPKAAPSPEIRDALVALYNSTNGPGWKNNENWLSEAPVDQWYGVLTDCGDASLTQLVLADNHLVGPIPPELGNLSELPRLTLANNQLTGPIPPELGNLSALRELGLYGNYLTGPIPAELGNLSNLRFLWLHDNQLTGPIPSELGSLEDLTSLWLAHNRLTGPIPSELGSLEDLISLWLDANRLTGSIPSELGNLSELLSLGLKRNQLTGPIPPELGNLSTLRELGLFGNQLTGEIPPELGRLSNLTWLGLGNNQLTGAIPPELGNLSHLEVLNLAANQLTGPIPPELGNLSALRELYLSNNQLTGPIPSELGSLEDLILLQLTSNRLTGCVPAGLAAVEKNIDRLGLEICTDS